MERNKLEWAKANFTLEVEAQPNQLLLLFKERESNCIMDFAVSTADNTKQLQFDMNQFMLELEKIL
jgi:hypothetical protein